MKRCPSGICIPSLRDEIILAPTLTTLEKRIGGERRPFLDRAGAFDLLSYLEVPIFFVLTGVANKLIDSYLTGLLKTKDIEAIGTHHRQVINDWLLDVEQSSGKIVSALKEILKQGGMVPSFQGKQKSLSIIFYLGIIPCYVVLNQPHVTLEALDMLPNTISRVLRFSSEIGIPKDATEVQLFFDTKSNDWRYLFAPTPKGIGHFIDRVIDINTGEYIKIASPEKFIEFAKITQE